MLSKTSIHAINAVAKLAVLPEGEFAGAAALAREIGAPPNYFGKLCKQLTDSGLLVAQKGLRGGVRLARPAGEITLFDVVDPIEHLGRRHSCLLNVQGCSCGTPCTLHMKWAPIRDGFLEFLQTTTITEVAAG